MGAIRRLAVSWGREATQLIRSTPHLRLRIASSLVASAGFVCVILAYTRGKLLVGGDLVGIYSLSELSWHPTANNLIPAICVGASGGNFYVGFYVAMFIGSVIVTLALQSLYLETLRGIDQLKLARVGFALIPLLYLSNPTTVTDTFKTLDSSVLVQNAGVCLFLVGLLRLTWRSSSGVRGIAPAALSCVLGTALATEEFPLSFRILALFVLLTVLFSVVSLLRHGTGHRRLVVLGGLVAFASVLLGFAVDFVTALPLYRAALPGGLSSASQIAGAFSGSSSLNTFGSLTSTFRLLDTWGFWSGFVPYHTLYVANPTIVLLSFLWPVFALCTPLLLREKSRDNSLLTILVALALAAIAWESGSSGPFAPINGAFAKLVPTAAELFPPYFLSINLLSKLFPVLVAYSIAWISHSWRVPPRLMSGAHMITRKSWGAKWSRSLGLGGTRPQLPGSPHPWRGSIAVAIAVGLMATAYPTWSGLSESQYFDQSVKGIVIPADYETTRTILVRSDGSAVLFPGLTTYIQTSWNYQGSQAFYPAFYYPAHVLVPDSLGSYSLFRTNVAQQYLNVTSPLRPGGPSENQFSGPWKDAAWGINYTASAPALLHLQETDSPSFTAAWGPQPSLNLSNSSWISIAFTTSNSTWIWNNAGSGKLWFGIGSSSTGTIGWYVLRHTSYAVLTLLSATSFSISVLTNQSDDVNPGSWYLPSEVSGFYFMGLFNQSMTNLTLGDPIVTAEFGSSIDPMWIESVEQLGFGYVFFDHTIIDGAAQSSEYADEVESAVASTCGLRH